MAPRKKSSFSLSHKTSVSYQNTNKARYEALLSLFDKNDDVLIVINADPDAIASAMALKRLLRYRVNNLVIAYPNEIRRLSNLTMVDRLRISMVRLHNIVLDDYSKKVIIDSQPSHHPAFEKISFHAVIDHHPVSNGWQAAFVDIRPDYGATASMMVEYLRAADMKPSVSLATALFYAIKVDTGNFEKKSRIADAISFRYLFDIANKNLVKKFELSTLRRSELNYFKAALNSMVVRKNRMYVHVGSVPSPDVLVLIADFMNTVHDVQWTLVSGIHNEKLVVIFRCDGYRKNAGKMAAAIFGGIGSAGGHREAARAEIPLKNLDGMSKGNFTSLSLKKMTTRHM